MRGYHDLEWGRPVADDRRLFEKLSREGFLSGLSWLTILRKRENFRRAFRSFDIDAVARFNQRSVARLMADAGIVCNRAKIEATVNNARRCVDLVDEVGSLAGYVGRFEPDADNRATPLSWRMVPSTSPEATAMSKDLKRRGWAFVARQTSTPSCRAWASSTTTCPAASPGRRLNRRAVPFGGPVRSAGHCSA
jgi:DNA-3-methyladenine glycosylase I